MSTHNIYFYREIRKYYLDTPLIDLNKYLREGLIKNKYIFYKSIINRWSVGFIKLMIDYEILVNSQHKSLLIFWRVLAMGHFFHNSRTYCSSNSYIICIMKTCLLKYTENFTTNKKKKEIR